MEEQKYFVMVGNQLLAEFTTRGDYPYIEFCTDPEYAIAFKDLNKAKENAKRLSYLFESTNSRVVKKVVKTVYEDVKEGEEK